MRLTILILIGLCLFREGSSNQCRLVSGNTGLCVGLGQCNLLIQLLRNLQKPLPKDVGLLIRDSFFCNSRSKKLSVCCPREGVVRFNNPVSMGTCEFQDGSEGSCVVYTKCFPFIQMLANLRRPLPSGIPIIMKEVYLCGQEKGTNLPKICCPQDAILQTNFLDLENNESSSSSKPTTTESTTRATTTKTTTSTTTSTTTTTTTEKPHSLMDHPGMNILSNMATCGRAVAIDKWFRIVGGREAKVGQFPWLANIGYSERNQEVKFRCGGTLIGPQHVLTAAHCVTSLGAGTVVSTIRLGEHNLTNPGRDCGKKGLCADIPQNFVAEKILVHPKYNVPNRYNNDIAIIKLNRPVIESDFVSPICLPVPDNFKYNLNGSRIEVAGWGAIDKLATK